MALNTIIGNYEAAYNNYLVFYRMFTTQTDVIGAVP